jgi:hypothetical protein
VAVRGCFGRSLQGPEKWASIRRHSVRPHRLMRQGTGAETNLACRMKCVAARCLGAPCPLHPPSTKPKLFDRLYGFNGGFNLSQWDITQERLGDDSRSQMSASSEVIGGGDWTSGAVRTCSPWTRRSGGPVLRWDHARRLLGRNAHCGLDDIVSSAWALHSTRPTASANESRNSLGVIRTGIVTLCRHFGEMHALGATRRLSAELEIASRQPAATETRIMTSDRSTPGTLDYLTELSPWRT